MSINKVILVGYAADKPDMRYFDNGSKVATFRMGTTERGYTGENGIKVLDRSEWHTIVTWKGLADIAEKYIKKGTQIYIEGKIHYRYYDTQNGKRYATEIHAFSLTLLGVGGKGDVKYTNDEDNAKPDGVVNDG